ncbi:nuclease EXOG, mitochondrial isoform X1 [Python bivittatus]|uniref:Nuclease EXOG, mitochondrial n=1 Tax=Python bivittatus TaxID=176946 RepID=A0A9F2N057_PYTBI|nr:nuclease EXOG, mitochondrial isoform X1 [Python bivittatus]
MTEALGARLVRSRFFGGFVCGAAVGATVSGLLATKLLRKPAQPPRPDATQQEEPPRPPPPLLREELGSKPILEKYGFPAAGTQIRYYTNHALSYDQAKRVPRWVIEHISKYKTSGSADRKHCKFKPDPNIPSMFSAMNEDYIGSGWSRGHMAPAGNNKYSPEAMAETFYLSNIVPQNYENNAGFWNRVEMYCRDLTERFEDVWVVSGPLMLPQLDEDGKKKVVYQVIGTDDVAVPSHLYKVILARRSDVLKDPLVLGAFVIPNNPVGFDHQLQEFQVGIEDLEKMSGLIFFPELDKAEDVRNICEVDTCKLMSLEEFTLYVTTRKLQSARTLERLGKIMSELHEKGIEPDEYLLKVYNKKKEELAVQTPAEVRERKVG